MKTLKTLLACTLAALLLAQANGAETVIVPYDATKPLASQHPDQLYLPYDRFLELWAAAQKTRHGLPSASPKTPYLLTSARYEGAFAADTLTVRGIIELGTYGEKWTSIPLHFGEAKIDSLKLDGAPVPFQAGQLIIENPGKHTLEIAFEVPFPQGSTRLGWDIPATAGTLVTLTLPQPGMHATFEAGSGTVEQQVNGQTLVSATLGEATRVNLRLDSSVALSRMTRPALARLRSQIEVNAALATVRTRFAFSFPAARQDRLTVALDKNATLVDLSVPNLKSWKLTRGAGAQTLEVQLNEPAKERFTFTATCERNLPALPARVDFPFFSAAAQRVEQEVGFFAGEGIDLAPHPADAFRQVTWSGAKEPTKDPDFRLLAAYAATGAGWAEGTSQPPAFSCEVRPAEAKREAEIHYVYQVNRRKIDLIASLKLSAKTAHGKSLDLFTAALTVPPGFEVQAVQSERLKEWWLESNTLHVRFKGEPAEQTPLVVYLVKNYPAAPDKLELTPLTLPEFQEVRGDAILAAHKGVSATLALSPGAKEVDPAQAALDFSILPPMERKRGFTFPAQNFHGSVTLEALPARANTVWVMDARVREGTLSLSTRVQATLRQGSLNTLAFSLPASAPEARVAGNEIRETTSRIVGERRVYEVVFQNDLYDCAEFSIDLDLPAATAAGDVQLPSPEFPGMDRVNGFVIAQNDSESEMRLHPTGLDPAQRADIPFLPPLSQTASLFRAQPGWSLGVAVTSLQKTAGRDAFVSWAEITTALRKDGTEWHRAVYHLQNRSLQFLPVKLPPGSELVGARVAGQAVRADQAENHAILLPLIKTKPGDLSYDVEVVYRRTGRGRLGALARAPLDDPDLLGITVEKTLWNIALPEGHTLLRASGNMEPVLAEVNETEKLEGSLSELKSLASVITSASSSDLMRRKASSNYAQLAKNLEESSRLDSATASSLGSDKQEAGEGERLGEKTARRQRQGITRRKLAIQSELTKQTAAIDELKFTQKLRSERNTDSSDAAVSPPQEWTANQAFKIAAKPMPLSEPTPSPAAAPLAAGGNLYINDNVLLQNAVQSQPALTLGQRAQIQQFTGSWAPKKDAKPEADKEPSGRSVGQAFSSDYDRRDTVLSTARGNAYVQDGTPREGANFTLAEMPAAPYAASAPVADQKEDASTSSVEAAAPPALRPAGRISLAVDFPLEGPLYHFKKVKANAALTLWVGDPPAFARWQWTLLFAALALLLAAASKGSARLATLRKRPGF